MITQSIRPPEAVKRGQAMRKYYGIDERKVHNMLWDSVRYYMAIVAGGLLAGVMAIAVLLIYCRMAGPLM